MGALKKQKNFAKMYLELRKEHVGYWLPLNRVGVAEGGPNLS